MARLLDGEYALRWLGLALDEAAVRAHCARLLADYKVPETVTFNDEPLPRNANGKLLKRALRSA